MRIWLGLRMGMRMKDAGMKIGVEDAVEGGNGGCT